MWFCERQPSNIDITSKSGIHEVENNDKSKPSGMAELHKKVRDRRKSVAWMNGTVPEPYAVKYGDNFYRIVFLWVTPELPESTKNWQIPVGAALGAGWVYTGTLFLKGRKKKANC